MESKALEPEALAMLLPGWLARPEGQVEAVTRKLEEVLLKWCVCVCVCLVVVVQAECAAVACVWSRGWGSAIPCNCGGSDSGDTRGSLESRGAR